MLVARAAGYGVFLNDGGVEVGYAGTYLVINVVIGRKLIGMAHMLWQFSILIVLRILNKVLYISTMLG